MIRMHHCYRCTFWPSKPASPIMFFFSEGQAERDPETLCFVHQARCCHEWDAFEGKATCMRNMMIYIYIYDRARWYQFNPLCSQFLAPSTTSSVIWGGWSRQPHRSTDPMATGVREVRSRNGQPSQAPKKRQRNPGSPMDSRPGE